MPELGSTPRPPKAGTTDLATYLQGDVFKRHLNSILPKHLNSERFVSICLRQLTGNPDLLKCTLPSVIGGMMEAATLGLEIGTQGESYLIPYNQTRKNPDTGQKYKQLEATYQIGVWGYMALAHRSERILDVQTDVVFDYEVDEGRFSFQKGSDAHLHHKPLQDRDLEETERIAWTYAVVRTTNGGVYFDAKDPAWIARIRERGASNTPAWNNFFAEQSQAKVLKHVLKRCPRSRELARAITLDDEAEGGVAQAWTVDPSLMLPAETLVDETTAAARAAMEAHQDEQGADQPREPEPVEVRSPTREQQRRQQQPDLEEPDGEEPGSSGWWQ